MDSIVFLLLFQVILIALNAVFACAEIAVLSVSEAKLDKLAEEGNGKAKRLRRLTSEPAKFLATIQVAITLSGFLGSAFAADNFSEPLVNWVISLGVSESLRGTLDAAAVIVITLILSYFTLIFGELVPKRLAMKKSESIALGISGIVSFISFVFKPIVWFLSFSTNIVLRICGVDPNEEEEEVSEEEIKMMVDVGSEKGTIEHDERELIQNVFEFNDRTAAEIATHRVDVTILWLEDGDDVWAEVIHNSRHTLYPVCDGTADNIVGILNAKDYFRLSDKSRESVMKDAVHPAYFVPETIKADILFRNMKKSRNSIAIVMDEYGGMEGIVTINDLVEALVGELNDEPEEISEPEPSIEKIADDKYRVKGNISLQELEEATGISFENDEYDTFTGLVFDALGVIPADGEEKIAISLPRMDITVLAIDQHQVEEAEIVVLPDPEKEEE